jgi:hypothetical protein
VTDHRHRDPAGVLEDELRPLGDQRLRFERQQADEVLAILARGIGAPE